MYTNVIVDSHILYNFGVKNIEPFYQRFILKQIN